MRTQSGEARLTDLCPEDKKKIGELVKKLAEREREKEEIKKQFENYDSEQQRLIDQL